MTKKVYRVLSLKASLLLLVSNPLNPYLIKGLKHGCNVTLLTNKVYQTLANKTSLAYLVSPPLNLLKAYLLR